METKDSNVFSFEVNLTSTQKRLLRVWTREQDEKVADKQQGKFPNYGAVGGAYSWIITRTSVGVRIGAENSVTKDRIDLTDYSSW